MQFITGSEQKFTEAKSVIPELVRIDIDLPEIQEIDARKIIEHKLQSAFVHHDGPFVVEDTSLYVDCLGGLPGPLIKWFMKTVGNEGLSRIVQTFGNNKATAKTIVGYARKGEEPIFCEGAISGQIVTPQGSSNFGWDPIFLPDGYERTFAGMLPEEKNAISMRRLAFEGLKKALEAK